MTSWSGEQPLAANLAGEARRGRAHPTAAAGRAVGSPDVRPGPVRRRRARRHRRDPDFAWRFPSDDVAFETFTTAAGGFMLYLEAMRAQGRYDVASERSAADDRRGQRRHRRHLPPPRRLPPHHRPPLAPPTPSDPVHLPQLGCETPQNDATSHPSSPPAQLGCEPRQERRASHPGSATDLGPDDCHTAARHHRDDDRRPPLFGRSRRRSTASSPSSQARDLGYDRPQRQRLFDGDAGSGSRHGSPAWSAPMRQHRATCADRRARCGRRRRLEGTSAAAWWGIPGNQLEPFHVVRLRDRSDTPPRADRRHEPDTAPGQPRRRPRRHPYPGAGPGAVRRRRYAAAGRRAPVVRRADGANGRQRWSARLVSGATLHAMLGDLAQRGRAGIRVMRQVLSTRGLDYIPRPATSRHVSSRSSLMVGCLRCDDRSTRATGGLDRPRRPARSRAPAGRGGPERAVPLQPDRSAARRASDRAAGASWPGRRRGHRRPGVAPAT